MAYYSNNSPDAEFPSGYLRVLLDHVGVPADWQTRSSLLVLIEASMAGWTPRHRATDELAQIALNLMRERKLAKLWREDESKSTQSTQPSPL
jgi:hypothetical protein